MEKNIVNITSDGRVECNEFNMSKDEFYDFMMKHTISDYEFYHLDYDRHNSSLVLTYKGVKYLVKHDNKDLKEVYDRVSQKNTIKSMSFSGMVGSPLRKRYPTEYDDDYDRLLIMNSKQKMIEIRKKWIKLWEGKSTFFNKNKLLAFNDLCLEKFDLDSLSKIDAFLTVILTFLNLFGFFSMTIVNFYLSLGYFVWLTFIPFIANFCHDLSCMFSDKGKKPALYYVLYPLLYLNSKKLCKERINRYTKEIKQLQEETEEFLKQDSEKKEKRLENIGIKSLNNNKTIEYECVDRGLELDVSEEKTETSGHTFVKTKK